MYYYMYVNMALILLFIFMFMFIMFLYFLLMNYSLFIEMEVFSINSMKFSLIMYFDFKSFMFMSVVMLISSMILIYSISYMEMDYFKFRFLFLLSLFVFSMLLMIMGQNLLMILLGWDGLGLISYCLVIYYNSWSSYNAGMLTILSNRLGDIGILISIGLMSLVGSWNYMFFSIQFFLLMLMMLLCFITKSAQIPFSSWLPAAMAAPTPISSLVHSSTLVTAGIYLLMRFYNFICMNLFFKSMLLYMGLLTMFMAGLMANLENDFKKIIALSTLSQLGLMMMCLCLSLKLLSFFHLIIHALFKSLLFMCVGLMLHSMLDNQDIRFMGSMNFSFLLTLMYFNCSNLALCGFPFMSGFYSKDLIVEMALLKNSGIFVMLIFYVSIGLTVMYSFRLLFYINKFYLKIFSFNYLSDSVLMNFSMMILFLSSILGGSIFSKILYSSVSLSFISTMMKLLVNMYVILGGILGISINYFFNSMMFFKFNFFLNIIYFMKKMFGLNYLFEYYMFIMNYSVDSFFYIEKGGLSIFSLKFFLNIFIILKYNLKFINILNLLSVIIFIILLV